MRLANEREVLGRRKASGLQTKPSSRRACADWHWHTVRFCAGVRKPRVMQLVLSLSPGGTERLVIEIVRALRDAVDAIVCCLDEPGAWAAELEAIGIPVVSLGRTAGFHP